MSYTVQDYELEVVIEDKWKNAWDYIYACEHDEDIELACIIEKENKKYNDLLHESNLKWEKEHKIKKKSEQNAEYEAYISELQAEHKSDYEAEQQVEFNNHYKNCQALWKVEYEAYQAEYEDIIKTGKI